MPRRTVATILVLSFALVGTPLAGAAPQKPAPHTIAASGSKAHHARAGRPKFRPSRAAAEEARRLGAVVGQGCKGKADIARNDRQRIVLCSNGKTYVVDAPGAAPAGAPPVECSLAGTGPQPACFGQ